MNRSSLLCVSVGMTLTSSVIARRALAVVTAAGLVVSAVVHLRLAGGYDAVGTSITQGDLFRIQAVLAGLAAIALLVRPNRAVLVGAAVVGAGSLLALVATVYLRLPAIGPFPALYEPIWYHDKIVAAGSAGVAAVVAGVTAAWPRRAAPAALTSPARGVRAR